MLKHSLAFHNNTITQHAITQFDINYVYIITLQHLYQIGIV